MLKYIILAMVGFFISIGSVSGQSLPEPVTKLRAMMKYKFALDFLLVAKPETSYLSPALLKECLTNPNQTDMTVFDNDSIPPRRLSYVRPLEAFSYFLYYFLYKVRTTDSRDSVYLLASRFPTLAELFLLDDSSHYYLPLDRFEVNSPGGSGLTIDSLNGHQVLRVERTSFGSGHYSEDYAILGIINKKFEIIFSGKWVERSDWMMPHDTTANRFYRTMSKCNYVDLNGDGYLDMVVETRTDIVDGEGGFNPRQDSVITPLSTKTDRYIWDEAGLRFVQSE